MTRKRKISIGIVTALMTVLTGTALALSSNSFNTGTVVSYDFGGVLVPALRFSCF